MGGQEPDIKQAFDNLLIRLEKMILIGEIKPRERLVETDLARRLGVSRTWIRDAIKLLQANGLVKVAPYKGAMVADLTEQEVNEIYFVRVHLEKIGSRLAVENVTSEHIARLRELAARIEKSYREDRFDLMLTANSQFHDHISELCGNQTLIQMTRQLKARFFILNTFAWALPNMVETLLGEHQAYITALETGDLDTLDQLAEKHISYSKDLYLRQIKLQLT